MLPIAPSTYDDHLAKPADPTRFSARARRGEALRTQSRRVFLGEPERLRTAVQICPG